MVTNPRSGAWAPPLLCDPEQTTRLLRASVPSSRHGDDDNTHLTGWFESDRRQLLWGTHLQADEGEGDAVAAEVLQEPCQPQDHGVVGAADMGAVQHGAARAGCCGRRREPVTPARGASRARPSRALCSSGKGSGARGDSSSCLLQCEGWPFPSRRREGSSVVSVGEQPPSPHEDKGHSPEGGGQGRRP